MLYLMHFMLCAAAALATDRSGRIAYKLLSSQGSRQGCGLGMTLFDLDIANNLAEAAAIDPDVHVMAVHDDVMFIGPPSKLAPVVDRFTESMAKRGSLVQGKKSTAYYFHSAPLPADFLQWTQRLGIRVEQNAGSVVGAIIARDHSAAAKEFDDQASDIYKLFGRLHHPLMPTQHSLLLLRSSAQAGVDYMLRATRPDFSHEGASKFDAAMMEVLLDKLQITQPLSLTQTEQVRLPVKLGGLGFRSKRQLAPIAFFSSYASCAPLLVHHPYGMSSRTKDVLRTILRDLQSAIDQHSDLHKLADLLPPNAEVFLQFYAENPDKAEGLQAQLTTILTTQSVLACKSNLRADQVRMSAVGADDASRYLLVIPNNEHRKLSDLEISLAVKHRLGLSPCSDAPSICPDCNVTISPADHHHALTCKTTTPTGKTFRHNMAVNLLKRHARNAGAIADDKNLAIFPQSRKKPDLQVDMDLNTTLLDFKVINPLAPTHLGASDPIAGAERAKTQKYQDEVKSLNMPSYKFKPFVMDAFGRLGKDARSFIDALCNHASQHSASSSVHQVRNDLLDELSVLVHKYNSHITQHQIMRQRKSELERRHALSAVMSI